ncbi:MAG: chitobiase/beta-hexosaminidase C-terminal domain-containing protein [Fibrobacteres bacterium]|nr:chitobiase/beta-hexosaminidase C-terminal domain-containing protein [Fibrobacterota bacterium]
MEKVPIRKITCAFVLVSCLASIARAEGIDFESAAYTTDKTLVGADGWVLTATDPLSAQDDFKIQAGLAGEGRWAHAQSAGAASIYRSLGNSSSTTTLDMRWRWRGLSDSAHFCVGISGSSGSARQSNRALACMEPFGAISAQGASALPLSSLEGWRKGAWLYMRLALDASSGIYGKFTLYVSDDSLRASERVAVTTSMGGSGSLARIVLRQEAGSGFVDLDDFSWQPVATWQPPTVADTTWSSGKNWSTGSPPDSNTRVHFPDGEAHGCLLDRNATVLSVTVASGYLGTFNLGAQTLSVLENADFTGGAVATAAGKIRFPGARSSSLISPSGSRSLPALRHDGSGLVRLDGRALSVGDLTQSGGSFDFNGFDLIVAGAWQVTSGRPGTLRNLEGRSVIVTHGAHLEGAAPDTLLGLASSPKGWTLNSSGIDSLTARYALLGNVRSTGNTGYAYRSSDAGGNTGWIFFNVPAIAVQPRDTTLRPGETASFRISLASAAGATFQWLRNDVEIAGARDSVYTLTGLRKADSGAVFTCKATNPAGYVFSRSAILKVVFPAPTSTPAPQTLLDSLSVRLASVAPGARIVYSANGGPWQAYASALVLRDSTVLRAFAVLGPDTSALATLAFPKASLPILPAPGIQPEASAFADSVSVTLAPPVAGARVYYTLDGGDPDSLSHAYLGPFTLKATTTVRAIAYLAGYRPSPVATRLFTWQGSQVLPPPTAMPPGGDFSDSVVVHLLPPAGFPDAAVYWLTEPAGTGLSPSAGPAKYSDSLVIRGTCMLKALAISGSRASDTARWQFHRRLGAPTVTPKGRIFHDTLRIASSADSGAAVRYTVDGTDPVAASPLFPAQGIRLDSTVVLKAIAVKGTETSAAIAETYTLVPDTPQVSPSGGDYSSPIRIVLSSSSSRAVLYYTLDGSTPGPERGLPPYSGPIDLDSNATLKVVAVAGSGGGGSGGPIRIENYTFIATGNRSLAPGQRLSLSGNYSLSSPYKGASTVDVEILAADSVAAQIHGFRDILFGIRVSLPAGASAFPKVSFNAPAGEPRALYRLSPPGVVRWIASADTSTLDAPGLYFLAIDTAAPVLRFAGETFASGDSTRVVVTIEDNVQNLALDMERSDDSSANFAGREVNPVLVLAVNAKNPPGAPRPLTLKLRVSDHTRTTAFPADGSAYAMAQKLSAGARSPAVFRIGDDPKFPWDLIAVPLATETPLTLAQLRKANAAPGLTGSVLNPATGKYRALADNETLASGASVWLAAPVSLPSLAFPALQTATRGGASAWKLTLHPGWNQVADPDLAPLWWPVTRTYPESYQASPLKGLHAWDAAAGSYVHAEVLEPWRGYFAYFYGSRDTVINLLERAPDPPPSPAPAGPAAKRSGSGIGLRLAWPQGPDLQLGASEGAADGFGPEDEARPPALDPAGTRLFSDRGGARLETDIARWRPGAVYTWKVVAGLSARAAAKAASRQGNPDASPQGNTDVTGSLAAGAEFLPPGYAAWAVSASRGLRFPIPSDGSAAALPWHPGYADTLEVMAGPAAELEASLADVPLKTGPFAARVLPSPGGYLLRMELPAAARVRLTLFSLDGRAVEDRFLDLPAGRYRISPAGRLAPGLYALRLLAAGTAGSSGEGGIPALTALKVAIP